MAMSAVIGNLRANLGLDTAQFDRGLDNAQSRLAKAQQSFMRFAAGAAAVGTALGALGVQTINSAREISRLSQVANAAPEEFQRWAAASQTVGIEQDKLADILKDVNDRVGDFLQTGGGPMADFFENIAPRVGVTAEQFAKLSGPEALQLYVDSLNKAGVSQSEMTFYLEAMASDLTLLQPLLRNGGAELDRLGDRAEGFGAVMDQKTIASLARAKRSLEEVQTVFRGFGNMLGAAIAPMIEHTANTFVALSQAGAPLNTAMKALSQSLGVVIRGVTSLAVLITGRLVVAFIAARTAALGLRAALLRSGLGVLVVAAGEGVYWLGRLISATGSFGNAMAALKDLAVEVWGRIIQGIGAIPEAVSAAAAGMEAAFLGGLRNMLQAFQDFTNGVVGGLNETFNLNLGYMDMPAIRGMSSPLGRAEGEALRNARAQAEELRAALEGIGAPLPTMQKLRDAVSETADETSGAASATDRLNRALGGLGGAGGGSGGEGGGSGGGASSAKKGIDEVNDRLQSMEDQANRGAEAIGNMFTGMLDGSKSLKESLKGLLMQIAQFQMMQGIKGLFGAGGASSGVGSFLGGLIGQNANGTNNWRGGLTMLGERGRELVNLPQGSQVVRNADTEKMLSGGGQSVMRVELSPDLEARILQQAEGQSVSISRQESARTTKNIQKSMRTQPKNNWGLA